MNHPVEANLLLLFLTAPSSLHILLLSYCMRSLMNLGCLWNIYARVSHLWGKAQHFVWGDSAQIHCQSCLWTGAVVCSEEDSRNVHEEKHNFPSCKKKNPNPFRSTTHKEKLVPTGFHSPQIISAMFTAKTGFMVLFFVHY